MKDQVMRILTDVMHHQKTRTDATNELFVLFGVSKNEAICNCANEYWKEDEGGDWYCTIHDKQA